MSKEADKQPQEHRKKMFEELIAQGQDRTIRRMLQRIVDEQVNRISYVRVLEESENEKQAISER